MKTDKTVITDPAQTSITPAHIDANRYLTGAFGKHEREISAGFIVLLCQRLGSWQPFTYEELNTFYAEVGAGDGFWFNGLDTEGYVVRGDDGKYRVTLEFVAACYKSRPKAA